VSARYGYDMNSLAVPRKAKEAIGGISALRREDGSSLTINVEYNLLDPLLRANGWADGDVNDATGYSPYPGERRRLRARNVARKTPELAPLQHGCWMIYDIHRVGISNFQ
jgi:hypothetical protein